MTPHADWIAVDWGTTHLRVWAMHGQDVLDEAASDNGMGRLTRDGYEPALLALIEGWLAPGHRTPVVACGMVGSRQGWLEAPYRRVPCTPLDPASLVEVRTDDARLDVRLIPGLRQDAPADVMRGEETQIAGALAGQPGFDGVICLPGTHSKWAQISAGEVTGFQTAMTGEMFALMSEQSVLRHGMAGDGWDDAAFDSGVRDGLQNPEKLTSRLFALRAEGLLAGLGAAAARARLSGLLIGVELAGARGYWLGQPILIVGADRLSALYARALAAQGSDARALPAAGTVLSGLIAARPRKVSP